MDTYNLSTFRNNMAAVLDQVDAGANVLIKRKQRTYAIVAVDNDDMQPSAQLQAKIAQAREEHKNGQTLKFDSAASAQHWMDGI